MVALANSPGRIKPGMVDGMMHIVDMYPTFAGRADTDLGKTKPLDGVDVWSTISEGRSNPRETIVYNVEPYRAGVQGKSEARVDYTIADAYRAFRSIQRYFGNIIFADQYPEKVKELQGWIADLAKQAAPPLFLLELVRLGVSHKPEFPDVGGTYD